ATVSGTVTLTATAADNVGVLGVQFQVDGLPTGAEDATAPYTAAWTTTALSEGSYTLTAVARDAAGNRTTSSPVTVTVANAPTATYTVTVTPSTVAAGGTLTVRWTAPSGTSASDWLGLYRVGEPATAYTWWTYTGGTASGDITLTAPAPPGSYELRYLLNDGYTEAATSGTVTVTSATSDTTAP
ncbi:MAG: Ig-like domain-containing protein, partial [bacterium]